MNALQLFQFVATAHSERGWGRALRSAVAGWYLSRPVPEVAADMLKCPGYAGWTHRDLLRLAHPAPGTPAQNALFQWAVDGKLGHLATPDLTAGELRQVYAVDRLQQTQHEGEAASLVEQYSLTHDMVPDRWMQSSVVWESLLTGMSYTGIIGNLVRLADSGLLVDESPATALVVARLIDRRRAANSEATLDAVLRARDEYTRNARAIPVILDALKAAEELVNVKMRPVLTTRDTSRAGSF